MARSTKYRAPSPVHDSLSTSTGARTLSTGARARCTEYRVQSPVYDRNRIRRPLHRALSPVYAVGPFPTLVSCSPSASSRGHRVV
jgi:hypothetical protein